MNTIPSTPLMCKEDINFIESFLSPTDIMLEWGSGGSTMYFAPKVSKYYSIEHDVTWSNTLANNLPNNVEYHFVPNDYPMSEPSTRYEEIKTYVNKVDDLGVKIFDKVFIDGRGRSFCSLKILNYISSTSVVLIHDFWSRECRGYFEVFKYYDIIDYTSSEEGVIALKKK